MKFSEKLKKVMLDKNISQKQLSTMTGISPSCISLYLSDSNIPGDKRKKEIAKHLGLKESYFIDEDTTEVVMAKKGKRIPTITVDVAAELLGMTAETVRVGLIQQVFPWGYAIKTSENRWRYFINEVRFREIERLEVI